MPGYRFAHTMIRVFDLEKSLDFYCRILGMEILRSSEYPEGRFTNTFVGYGPEATHASLELTYNWDHKTTYEEGESWGHIAIEVPDVFKACAELSEAGANITRPAGPMKNGTRIIAFVEDPDGHKIELLAPGVSQSITN